MAEKDRPKRRKHSAAFKAKVTLVALREDKTQGQIAGEFAIHPLQVGQWKKQATEGLPELFGRKPERDAAAGAEHEQRLYSKIGQLQTELD